MAETKVSLYNLHEEFNKFQTAFYTSREKFNDFSRFEVKRNGYKLLNSLGKGFPNLADLILNLKGFEWSGAESHELLKALQSRFTNNFNKTGIPQFIYYKSETVKTEKTKEKVKQTKDGLIFSSDIQIEICNILFYDSKTYDILKFSEKVQYLGKQLAGDFVQKEAIKKSKKKG